MITQANPLGTNQQKFNERAILWQQDKKTSKIYAKTSAKRHQLYPFYFVTKQCPRVQTIVLSNGTKK